MELEEGRGRSETKRDGNGERGRREGRVTTEAEGDQTDNSTAKGSVMKRRGGGGDCREGARRRGE
jgi:hypothetical protein